ncbi:MAG: hypothetical protein AAGL98_00290 [Planctomycetota bacterium]
MGELTQQRFPWEPVPIDETVAALQRDFAYAVQYTAVLVHSNEPALSMLVNTQRGQIVPRGRCVFAGGSYAEFQDIGMPQPGAPVMTVPELLARVYDVARDLGLELAI